METKPFWVSKTFWGAVLAVLAPIAAQKGYIVNGEPMLNDIVSVLGGALAIYGRFVADTKLTVKA